MGPGHFAIALAAKPAAPKAPLWVLLLASEAIDLLCFGLMGVGIEKAGIFRISLSRGITMLVPSSIPWSHGLFMSVVWSVAAGAIAYPILRDRRASLAIGLVLFSHWLLDFLVHPAELPLLFQGSQKVGLGLWTTGPGLIASAVLEVILLAGGTAIYLANRRPKLIKQPV